MAVNKFLIFIKGAILFEAILDPHQAPPFATKTWLATRECNVMASLPVFAGTNQSLCNELLVGQQPLLLALWENWSRTYIKDWSSCLSGPVHLL